MARVDWQGEWLQDQVKVQVLRGMIRLCSNLVADIKKTLSGPRHGRIYKIGKNTYHVASAPGEPPAVLTGNLRAGISSDIVQQDRKVIGRVGTHVEYARKLELGTSKVAPRPYLRPVLDKYKAKIVEGLSWK